LISLEIDCKITKKAKNQYILQPLYSKKVYFCCQKSSESFELVFNLKKKAL